MVIHDFSFTLPISEIIWLARNCVIFDNELANITTWKRRFIEELENKARRCRAAVWSVRSCEASFDNAFQRYYLTNNVLLDQNKIKRSWISPAKPVITHQHKRRVK